MYKKRSGEMGLFSDTCTALIDPATGEALTGDALTIARQDRKWPRCGNKVGKKARFCNKCGQGAPGGWVKCPSCGKWVGNESNYCWNCNHPLHPDERVDIAGGVWNKDSEQFAQRFEVGDVQRILKEGLQIQEGCVAILIDGGKEKTVLNPGRHTPDGTLRAINWFGNPPPRSIVLVESGDVVFPVHIEDLRSSEEIPIDLYMEFTLAFRPSHAEEFLANLFKERRFLKYSDIGEIISGEIRYAANNLCNTSTIEDLVKDPARRSHLEDELSRTLSAVLKSMGLELIRVGATDFIGHEYEVLREKAGELDIQRRTLEFAQKARELASSDKMHEFKTDQELTEYVAQLAQEKQVSQLNRDSEIKLLLMLRNNELSRKEVEYKFAAEIEQEARDLEKLAHDIGMHIKLDDYTRDKLLKDKLTEADVEDVDARIRRSKIDVEVYDKITKDEAQSKKLRDLAEIDRQIEANENQTLKEKADILKGKSAVELAALADDPEARREFLKHAALDMQKDMSPQQILAALAGTSSAAAQALSMMGTNEKQEAQKLIEEYKQMAAQGLDRDERMLKHVTEMMAQAASRTQPPAPTQQIFK